MLRLIQLECFDNPNGAFLRQEIFDGQFAGKSFSPGGQHSQHLADIGWRRFDGDIRVERQAVIAIEDNGESADDREINPATGAAGQQTSEPGK